MSFHCIQYEPETATAPIANSPLRALQSSADEISTDNFAPEADYREMHSARATSAPPARERVRELACMRMARALLMRFRLDANRATEGGQFQSGGSPIMRAKQGVAVRRD